MRDEVKWGRSRIRYAYQYKDRKTLAIHVNPDLTVSVDAPYGTTIEKIRIKILKRAGWIKKSQREFELYLPKQPPRRYINGETHRYLGRQYRLKATKGSEDSVKCYRGYFHVTCKSKVTPEKVKKLLNHWYSNKADQVFSKRYEECCNTVKRIGIKPAPLRIRPLKTRWGSCTKSGRIILNLELIKAPTECIDYVITHELCHLKEHNHSQKFWGLLEKVLPDYEKRKTRLNQYSDL